MATSTQYNLKSPAVKRILKEANELKNPTEDYFAQPLEENIFEWHFTIRGPKESCFCDGIYHGRLSLPTCYPLKPPSIILFTPNGRFQTNKKICLTISSHHPETWIPSWSIRTILLALISFMPSESLGTIGSLDYSSEERKELAKKSIDWSCNVCGKIKDLLKERNESMENENLEENDKELLKMINFKGDVDQQNTPAKVDKVVTKIDNQDNEIDPQNIVNVSNQNENRNVSNDVNQINNLNRTDQQSSRIRNNNNNGILSRISATLICFLILVIILRRIYLTFF